LKIQRVLFRKIPANATRVGGLEWRSQVGLQHRRMQLGFLKEVAPMVLLTRQPEQPSLVPAKLLQEKEKAEWV
jgi:hypothetical protein